LLTARSAEHAVEACQAVHTGFARGLADTSDSGPMA